VATGILPVEVGLEWLVVSAGKMAAATSGKPLRIASPGGLTVARSLALPAARCYY